MPPIPLPRKEPSVVVMDRIEGRVSDAARAFVAHLLLQHPFAVTNQWVEAGLPYRELEWLATEHGVYIRPPA